MSDAQVTISTANKGFNLEELDSDVQNTFKVVLEKDGAGEPLYGLICVDKNSSQYRIASNTIRANRIQRSATRGKDLDTTTAEGAAQRVADIDSDNRAVALAVTVGWFGMLANGVPVDFNPVALPKLFDKKPTWQDAVSEELENRANFTKG